MEQEIDNSLRSSVFLTVFVGSVVAFYYYNKNAHSYWKKRGIDGPTPWPIVGNFLHILLKDRLSLELDWAKKYGKIYGIYQGLRPRLVVADAEVLQRICVKDFDTFTNHYMSEFSNEYQKNFLFLQRDEHWKRTRALMSPTFTSGKIKRMFSILDACADDLVMCFNEQLPEKGEQRKAVVNMKDLYNLFTMDAITSCCYGLKLERAGSTDLKTYATRNNFVRMAMRIFDFSLTRLMIILFVPKKLLRLIGFKIAHHEKFDVMAKTVRQIIDKRRMSAKKYDDYLQLLLDARLDDKMELNEMDLEENHHAGLTHESLLEDQEKFVKEIKSKQDNSETKQQVLSEIEIISGAMFLLLVGLETTSSLLTHCSYLLALNENIQVRLYEEIKKIAEYKDNKTETLFTYEALTSCNYLDAVISETLRFFTPVVQLDRVTGKEYHLEKCNLDLPKDMWVSTSYYAIMNDPDYWPEPTKFDPERFMPGNKEKIKPGAYCPFGLGPRHCIGMRFSLTESKLALAKIIMKYRFEPAPGASFPPKLKLSLGLIGMKKPHVTLVARD